MADTNSMIGHRTIDAGCAYEPTTHFPDKPPVAEIIIPRFVIPKPQILAFITSQRERLEQLYIKSDTKVHSGATRSAFHC